MRLSLSLPHDKNFDFEKMTELFSAIIITGGCTGTVGSTFIRSVEILRENGSNWCSLPDLPYDGCKNTQSGLITCGGYGNSKTCLTFSDGQWRTSHHLQYHRYSHSSWMSPQGVVLIGGYNSEILTENGGSTPSFTTNYFIK